MRTVSKHQALLVVVASMALAVSLGLAMADFTDKQPARRRADTKNADGTYGKDHVDPVKLNGPIFVDWPVPKLALVFSGAQQGYIEPCGCAGLENQKGGMSRRHQLIKQLKADKWPVVSLDAGGLIKRFGRQQELKYAASVDALKKMNYDAASFGTDDLRLPADRLLESASGVTEGGSPFVATNVALFSFEDNLVPRAKTIINGGIKLGVLSVVGDEEQRKVRNDDLKFKPAAAAIAEMLPTLKRAKCDKLILLAHTSLKEATDLAKKFGDFDFVATTGGADEPPAQSTLIGTKTQLIEVGHKGMFAVVIGLYDDKTAPERYQRVPLDARFGESPEMTQVMADYQSLLQTEGLAGLGVKATPHPSGQAFVGSAACADCHSTAYAIWSKTPHAHATQTLVDLHPQRHFDPECLSCHVTGWEPQRYYPFRTGYQDLKKSAHMVGNGCENCHGPGSKHVAAESGDVDATDKQIKELRAMMRLTKEAANNKCLECHDLDNSPDYKFDKYWPKVEHKGKN